MHVREQTSPVVPASIARSPGLWPVRYRLIGLTFALSMLLYVDRVAISTARSPITSELGLSDTQFGWVLSAFALGYALNTGAALLWIGAASRPAHRSHAEWRVGSSDPTNLRHG